MKKILLSIAAVFFAALTANAVITQQVVLKNGTVLYGYTQKQDMKGNIVFCTEKAVVVLDGDNVESITNERSYKLKDLNTKWEDWARQNNVVAQSDKNASLTLFDFIVKSGIADNLVAVADSAAKPDKLDDGAVMHNAYKVRVLERGKKVKYLELIPNIYNIKRTDIEAIKGERRGKALLSGINRVYTMKNGREVEGQYAGETNTTLSLFVNGDVVETFDKGDVIKYAFRPVNPMQDIFEQSRLIDCVRTKAGANICGVMIEQNYSGKKNSDNYVLIQQRSGGIQSVKISDISEIYRDENAGYAPKEDIILGENEVMINRTPATYVNVVEENDMLYPDSINNKVLVEKGGKPAATVAVEYNGGNRTGADRFQVVRLKPVQKKRETKYVFSYKDLAMSSIRPHKVETSVNNTTRAEYTVGGTGLFLLYDAVARKALLFEIK